MWIQSAFTRKRNKEGPQEGWNCMKHEGLYTTDIILSLDKRLVLDWTATICVYFIHYLSCKVFRAGHLGGILSEDTFLLALFKGTMFLFAPLDRNFLWSLDNNFYKLQCVHYIKLMHLLHTDA